MIKDALINFTFLNTKPILLNSIFVNGGYSIKINPIAMGIFVDPEEKELIKSLLDGMKKPIATPKSIAKKIQRVKYRSRKDKRFLEGII
jgi:hypothetical protein